MRENSVTAMTPPPLRARIRNATLLRMVLTLTIAAFALPKLRRLGGSIRGTLYRNYARNSQPCGIGRAQSTLERAVRMHVRDTGPDITTEIRQSVGKATASGSSGP
jgi:hypothetical protein